MIGLDSNDPLHWYLKELDSIRPPTKEEETALWKHVHAQDKLAESASGRLIEAYLSLVPPIARRHSSTDINLLDLIQKGNESLLVALNTFTGNADFSVHAAAHVEDAIARAAVELRPKDR